MSSASINAPSHRHHRHHGGAMDSGFDDDMFSRDFDLVVDVPRTKSRSKHSSYSCAGDMPHRSGDHSSNVHFIPLPHAKTYRPAAEEDHEYDLEPIPYSVPSRPVPSPHDFEYHQHHQTEEPVMTTYDRYNDHHPPALVSPPAARTVVVSDRVLQRADAPTPPASNRSRSISPKKPVNKKRSHSALAEVAEDSKKDDIPLDPTSELSFQAQQDLRRERNRHHARKSRKRKKEYTDQIEEAVQALRQENARLVDLLQMDPSKAKQDLKESQAQQSALATQKFIQGLQQPRNRILDQTTLAFLRELWKEA